ncbi:unnamed protein product [Moneuplotes crassus]|uniref:Vesicle transport v-SNARE N-terminal domain-containing protein n=1 Tax=Euplotes crassus TaxID=5936 RepID=A0AAD2D6B2_EUPCR|nr:unnamed protein product [Moneuplotes crassus]
MATEFEASKDHFEKNIDMAREAIGDMNLVSNIAEKKSFLQDSKKLLEECKKNIQQMEYYWQTLDPSEKGYYKGELTEFKHQYEGLKNDFNEYQEAIKRDQDDEESDELTKLQANTRDKLLTGVGKLSDQHKQLDGIVKNGHETTEILRGANRNLVGQRGHIENAGRNNMVAQNELTRADRVVKKMRLREFCYKLILYLIIVGLFGGYIIVLIFKLK